MARLPRFVVAGLAHHVVHRVVAGSELTIDALDVEHLFTALQRSSVEQGVKVHAFAAVAQELHLLATPNESESLGKMMQALARFYVPDYNRRHARAGALWQGRFRAAPVGGAEALLTCMLYIDQAPLRHGHAGLVTDLKVTSAAHHAGLRVDAALANVPADSGYWALGNTPFERDDVYRRLLAEPLTADRLAIVEGSTLKGWPLGPGEFLAGLGATTTRRLVPGARGRPRKGAQE